MQIREAFGATLLVAALASPALSQTIPPYPGEVSLSGPRFGITALSDGVLKKLETEDQISLRPIISQFGWQFEHQFYDRRNADGPTMITEAVVLLGGLDQGVALPSLSWLVGVRTKTGSEVGLGPNVTPAGVALALAAGTTFRAGILNIPVNFAVVPSKAGFRASILTGFSLRR
jgi:hypothetical protein